MAGGAPLGNTNAKRARLFEQSFLREIKSRDLEDGDGETLRKIAAKLIDMALSGDVSAFRESRDTVDGKPVQQTIHSGDSENPLVISDLRVTVIDGTAERIVAPIAIASDDDT